MQTELEVQTVQTGLFSELHSTGHPDRGVGFLVSRGLGGIFLTGMIL